MAQINNHEFYGLDTAYVEKHKELFDFFEGQNLDVEINDDFEQSTLLQTQNFDFGVKLEKHLKPPKPLPQIFASTL